MQFQKKDDFSFSDIVSVIKDGKRIILPLVLIGLSISIIWLGFNLISPDTLMNQGVRLTSYYHYADPALRVSGKLFVTLVDEAKFKSDLSQRLGIDQDLVSDLIKRTTIDYNRDLARLTIFVDGRNEEKVAKELTSLTETLFQRYDEIYNRNNVQNSSMLRNLVDIDETEVNLPDDFLQSEPVKQYVQSNLRALSYEWIKVITEVDPNELYLIWLNNMLGDLGTEKEKAVNEIMSLSEQMGLEKSSLLSELDSYTGNLIKNSLEYNGYWPVQFLLPQSLGEYSGHELGVGIIGVILFFVLINLLFSLGSVFLVFLIEFVNAYRSERT